MSKKLLKGRLSRDFTVDSFFVGQKVRKKTLLGPHINSLKHGLANFLVLATIFAKKRVVVDYIKKDFKVFTFEK